MEKVIYKGSKKGIPKYDGVGHDDETGFHNRLIRLGAEYVWDGDEGYTSIYHFNGTTLIDSLLDLDKGLEVELTLFGDEKDIGEVEKLVLSLLESTPDKLILPAEKQPQF